MTDAEFIAGFKRLVREVNGFPVIENKHTNKVHSPIVVGLKFNRYKVLSIEGTFVYCSVNGFIKRYTLNELETRYNKWLIQKEAKKDKEKLWAKLSYEAKKRDGFKCIKCGATQQEAIELHAHHIIFKSNGGADELDNLVTLCVDCHAKAHINTQRGRMLKNHSEYLKSHKVCN